MFKSKADVWDDINNHPFDLALDQLAQIYIGASLEERKAIEEFVKRRPKLSWALVLYVRRVALRIQHKKENILAYCALELALLASKSDDIRDIVISLMLLKAGAERIGLDLKPLYDSIDPSHLTNSKSIFYKTENQPHDSIIYAIRNFGPPEWERPIHN